MFTGLIESLGRIVRIDAGVAGARLEVETDLAGSLTLGESLSVNGVCLTVAGGTSRSVAFDVGPETLRVSTLGRMEAGGVVNLERSMRADARFGGHFVQGHVDAVGVVDALTAEGDAHWVGITYPAESAALLVEKGAIAVDGVSLTVARLFDTRFEVMIVPFTWSHTTLSSAGVGGHVNLEFDIVGKYVARAARLRTPGQA